MERNRVLYEMWCGEPHRKFLAQTEPFAGPGVACVLPGIPQLNSRDINRLSMRVVKVEAWPEVIGEPDGEIRRWLVHCTYEEDA